MSLSIERVETQKQLTEFIKVPWRVYANDPNWVPWLYFERLEFFDKRKNPFFEHAEADYFIARRNGNAVGTIAALVNHRHNQFHDEKAAHFGVFELENDPEAGQALLETACEWAQHQGMEKILGPANLSSNDEFGMLIEGYERPPVLLMPYNPPYYNTFVEDAGFHKAMDLLAWLGCIPDLCPGGNMSPRIARVLGKIERRFKLTIRNLRMDAWEEEVEIIKRIYNSAWDNNWGFVPFTDPEIDHLAASLKQIADPQLAFIAEVEGEPVGVALSLPDVNRPLRRIRPGPSVIGSYLGAARMLLQKHDTDWLRVWALGVLPKYRVRGIDVLLYSKTLQRAYDLGYQWAEGSWILETNDMMNRASEMIGAHVYKRYRVYEKSLVEKTDAERDHRNA